jgi:hypothetical protein
MNQKIVYGVAGVSVVACIVLAGRSMVLNGKLQEQVADANAQILKLQSAQNETSGNDADDIAKTVEEQSKIIDSLKADNQALIKIFAMDEGYSDEELEGMTLKELIDEIFDSGYYVSVHDIWDDTEVVNAYKTGDDSKITDERDQYVLEQIRQLIPEIITSDDMTDYEKEKAVYDWQVKYVNFADDSLASIPDNDEDEDVSYLPYGVLKYREAICVGNATTFKLFMDCLDIPCMIIHSTEEGEHAWDLVQIDGDWYHVDITFDSISDGEPMYSYFNVTDAVKDDMGYPWDHDEFPAADSVKYNYAYMNSTYVKDATEVPQLFKDSMKDGSTMIYVRCEQEDENYIYQIVDVVNQHMNNGSMNVNNTIYDDDGEAVISIEYFNWDEDDNYSYEPLEPDNEMYDAINEEMQKVFGYDLSDAGYDYGNYYNGTEGETSISIE